MPQRFVHLPASASLCFLQRHAQAQEALEALPAHRELVQQQQELQVRLGFECVFAFSMRRVFG